ncbi:hypothetical protein DFW101_0898 [Solidesulfovibrio carbinoliphilus subsp. oakridgensis]|uniref:Uncharacterized protein n=1 Tax=Solidesulfovibrio carbinoliphilus subsp. oakridgensis TaxID=694327 RepID=G7Q5X7_9BACT|nr:hypothetical protein DFW101_0898 [Solidesulfovibrio carbinoliphilus subsp. oakridgensis]
MRSKTYEVKESILRFTIYQHKVWPDMAISMVTPIASERMITVQDWKRYICCQKGNDCRKQVVEVFAVPPGLLPFVVAFEAPCVPDFTH